MESSLIEDWEDVDDLSTSIYYPVSVCSGLKELHEKTGRFAFVGKPCDVKALRKLQKENWPVYGKIVLVISIFLHHTPTSKSTEMMIKSNEPEVHGSNGSHIEEMDGQDQSPSLMRTINSSKASAIVQDGKISRSQHS